MDYTRASEAPDSFHFWTAVVTLAGALRRRVWIDMRVFTWTPNFYVIFVGPAGVVTKSTAIGQGFGLLEKVAERESVKGIHFGPESMTWQALGQDLEAAVEYVRYIDDAGEERLAPMSCLTISVSELGTFLNMDDSKMVSFLIEMWDGKQRPFRHHTKDSGTIEIKNPWLNIIGCTTPTWLRENFPDSAIGGGLTSRIIFVYASEKRKFVAYPDEHIPAREYYTLERQLVDDLEEIAQLAGEYKLSEDARAWGRQWYERHWSERPLHMASQRYEGYLARKQTHIHKLALILAAARSSKMVVDKDHLTAAEMLLVDVERDMGKVFESVGVVDEAKHMQELVHFVRSYGFLTAEELYRMVWNVMSRQDFLSALRASIEGGALRKTHDQQGRQGVSAGRSPEQKPSNEPS